MSAANISKNHDNLYSKSKDWSQIVTLLCASFASLAAGTLYAFTSPAIPKLLTGDYSFTIEEVSYLPVIPPIAMVVVSPIFCKLADKIGRKYTLISTGVLHVISWILIIFAKNIYVFYISRVVYGISDAGLFAAMPAYIAEVTTPRIRSLYGNIMVIAITMGQFVANSIGFHFSIQTSALIMLIFPIIFIVTFFFMAESPYYLTMIGENDAAQKSLQNLRQCEDVKNELKQLDLDVQRQLSESGNFKDLWLIKSNRRALMIANLCRVFQQFSGFGCVIVYTQYIFEQGSGDISSGAAAMIVSGLLAIIIIFANVISDKLGKKTSMILSCLGCGIILLSEAIYFYLQTHEIVDLSVLNWFPLAAMILYSVAFCIGLGVVPTIMLGEIFSTNIRKHAATVTNMIFGICVCFVNKLFQVLMTTYGLWVPFCFFGLCCFVSSILSYFVIPDTKGKTLEEIQQMLKRNKGPQKTTLGT